MEGACEADPEAGPDDCAAALRFLEGCAPFDELGVAVAAVESEADVASLAVAGCEALDLVSSLGAVLRDEPLDLDVSVAGCAGRRERRDFFGSPSFFSG